MATNIPPLPDTDKLKELMDFSSPDMLGYLTTEFEHVLELNQMKCPDFISAMSEASQASFDEREYRFGGIWDGIQPLPPISIDTLSQQNEVLQDDAQVVPVIDIEPTLVNCVIEIKANGEWERYYTNVGDSAIKTELDTMRNEFIGETRQLSAEELTTRFKRFADYVNQQPNGKYRLQLDLQQETAPTLSTNEEDNHPTGLN